MGAVHRYATVTRWSGSTGVGYDGYERAHAAVVEPVEGELALSADPAFRGDPARLNPEQLLVQAASSCQLLSFLAVAARARVDVVAYEDRAVGEMPEDERPMRVARIVLRPRITIRGAVPRETRLLHLVEVAHRECFVANSLTSEIEIQPTFVRAQA
jgi:organic hydroperoxide reductase OsmC/OhrA